MLILRTTGYLPKPRALPVTRPTLLLLKGHPGSGKSTLAHALARALHWPLLDKDDIKDHLYTLPQGNQAAYLILWQVAGRQLALGLSVLVDSPLSYPESYQTGCELAQTHDAHLLVVETTLPEAAWRTRLDQRLRTESAHKITGWDALQQLLAQYQECWRYPIAPDHHCVIDTTQPVHLLVTHVLQRLARLQAQVPMSLSDKLPTANSHTNRDAAV